MSEFKIEPVLPRVSGEYTLTTPQTQATSTNGVGTPSSIYNKMMARWELILHLLGGTLAMREAKTTYLPQEEGEEPELYTARLARTILYGMYSRTIKSLSSIPFIDPIIVTDAPPELDYLKTNATDENLSLAELAQDLLEDALNYGLAHYIVDFPEAPEGLNLKQERDLDLKPFFARISPANLIGWKMGDDGLLDEIRVYEYVTETQADHTEVSTHKVRVITRDTHVVWTLTEGSDRKTAWIEGLPKPNKLGYVGLVTIYGNKSEGSLTGSPVLEELAWINLKHYQKQSDVDNIEHVANTPVLFAAGFPEEDLEGVIVGSHSLISTTSEGATLKYIEHTGAAIDASHKSIKILEERGHQMGAEFLTASAGSRQTAYAKSVDTGKSLSILQAITNNLSRGLEKGYTIAADWLKLSAEKVGATGVKVGEGIDLSLDSNDLQQLRDLALDGYLDTTDLQYELQRRGKISDSTELKEPKVKTPKVEDNKGEFNAD